MARRRKPPLSVAIALVALGAIGLFLLFSGLAESDALRVVVGLFAGVLLWGVAAARRWAFVLGVVSAVGASIGVLALWERDARAAVAVGALALAWMGLLLGLRWFWPAARTRPRRAEP